MSHLQDLSLGLTDYKCVALPPEPRRTFPVAGDVGSKVFGGIVSFR